MYRLTRETLQALLPLLEGYSVDEDYAKSISELNADWDQTVVRHPTRDVGRLAEGPGKLAGSERGDRDGQRASDPGMVVCAAGSMPGDLHKLWRTRDPKGYHVEYGYSCMGYEIAGGIGVKLAAPTGTCS